jgi:cytochrome c oxidase cbb3-type subunit 2
VVPESVMPPYGFLANNVIDGKYIQDLVTNRDGRRALHRRDGRKCAGRLHRAGRPERRLGGLEERYGGRRRTPSVAGKVNVRNFDGQPELTEMDALIAYIQVLGTMVDFSTFTPSDEPVRGRAWKPIPSCATWPTAGSFWR